MGLLAEQRDFRREVLSFLVFMARPESSLHALGSLPTEALFTSLCRLWLDEIYIPSEQYLDCYKGDLETEAVENFRTLFSEEEYEALERFHRFFELRLEMARREGEALSELSKSPFWKHTAKDAVLALDAFPKKELEEINVQFLTRRLL